MLNVRANETAYGVKIRYKTKEEIGTSSFVTPAGLRPEVFY